MPEKIVAVNKKARFEYHIEDSIEAGIALKGGEVKSLREGRASLQEAFARVQNGEVWLIGCHIPPYLPSMMPKGSPIKQDPTRARKLLLHREEIKKLIQKSREKGYALIPLRLYFKRGHAKVELGIGRGKKLFDKREAIKKREARREMEKTLAARKHSI